MTKKEMEVGSLYELNQQVMSQLPPQPHDFLQEQLFKIKNWFIEKDSKYFMLLCKEKADYTLFNFKYKNTKDDMFNEFKNTISKKAVQELEECVKDRGILMAINKASEDAWEIWIKKFFTKEVCMYMLFECGPMVIEV